MAINMNNSTLGRWGQVYMAISGGVIISTLTVALVYISTKWAIFILVAFLVLLLSFVVKQSKLYWLTLYSFFLVMNFGVGKSISVYFVNEEMRMAALMDKYGSPQTGIAELMVSPSDIIIFMLIVFWLITSLIKREKIWFPKISYLAVGYLLWATLASIFKADYFYLSFVGLVHQYKYFFIYLYIVNSINTREQFNRLISILMFGLFIQGMITVVGYHYGLNLRNELSPFSTEAEWTAPVYEDAIDEKQRALGSFANPVQTAMYLEAVIPFALALFLVNPKKSLRGIYFLLFLLGLVALWVTFSRAAFLSMASAIGIGLIIFYLRGFISGKLMIVGLYLGLVGALVGANMLYSFLSTRPQNIENRFPLMEKTAIMILENPIWGVGYNNHTAVKKDLFKDAKISEADFPVHNHYLALGSEVGIIGLLMYLSFFAIIAKWAFCLTNSKDPLVFTFSIAIFCFMVSLSIHLLGDHFVNDATRSLLWIYAGFITVFWESKNNASRQPEGMERKKYLSVSHVPS